MKRISRKAIKEEIRRLREEARAIKGNSELAKSIRSNLISKAALLRKSLENDR